MTQLAELVRGLKIPGFVHVDGEDPGGYVGADKKLRLNLDVICNGPAFLNKDVSNEKMASDVVESGNSPLSIEISYILPKGKKKTSKTASKPTEKKKPSQKRKSSNVAAGDPSLSKKARMYSPDQDIIIDAVSETEDQGRNGEDGASDDSDNNRGYDANEDLAFYENLEQAILEQRDDGGHSDDGRAENNHNHIDAEDDYDNSSDVASGWRCKI
ncbi:hypothetical protein QFC19_000105 [Naganishia cerealis]|uniref:Uncharacterized protein n=1 Tax=Naganishia cerealis TaxID=610337 RepID=A0ACC2WS48_9TREE|nr:hypothetical protein QFC19_000105 [Naganishia cerealis]